MKLLLLFVIAICSSLHGLQAQEAPAKSHGDLEIPKLRIRIEATPADIRGRAEQAAEQGPEALEALANHLLAKEVTDSDGRNLLVTFFHWFSPEGGDPQIRAGMLKDRQAVVERWENALPGSSFAKLAATELATAYAWDARGNEWGPKVKPEGWQGFREWLTIAKEKLEQSRKLEEQTPAWAVAAFTVFMGDGMSRRDFEEVADGCFEKFPECEAGGKGAIHALAPRWGGREGEWEPWLRGKLQNLPADVRARAYARTIMSITGFWHYSRDRKEEMFTPVKIDRPLLEKGMELLEEKYPDSPYLINGRAIIYAYIYDELAPTVAALKRADGRIDMRIWYSNSVYDETVKWIDEKNAK